MGQNCANGMSWLIKRTYLEEVGGLAAFSDYLAEDFFIGKALWSRCGGGGVTGGWMETVRLLVAVKVYIMTRICPWKGALATSRILWVLYQPLCMPSIITAIFTF